MAKKLPLIDPVTGLKLAEDIVMNNLPANSSELEGMTFGLGPEPQIPLDMTTQNPPQVKIGRDRVMMLFPPASGAEMSFENVNIKKDIYETFDYWQNMDIVYTNGLKNKQTSFYINFDTPYGNKYLPGLRNREFTCYVKVNHAVNNDGFGFRRLCFRIGGLDSKKGANRPAGAGRGFVEIGYPTADYPDVYLTVGFQQGNNVNVRSVNQYFAGDRVSDNRWLGLKVVSLVAPDSSHIWYALYADLNPFDENLNPLNNWMLKADIIFTGAKEYGGIVPTWPADWDAIVVEGWEEVEFKYISDREIDPMGLKPLHSTISTIADADDDHPLFRTAMVPTWNPNDYEYYQETDIQNIKMAATADIAWTKTSKNINRNKKNNKKEPDTGIVTDPNDPRFYGKEV